ncbi:hypothetical protein GTQ34_16135 [Muricauda sp. JGD-17]|uniref:Uncharacterized protein n=1 Tax=Flagellimonas ochracea TaxID=2696472 RepID=A0A964TFG7_9FLAO|nr:hypothetical protein [Allomuricauda ochracea]NAY93441.1 hypothetical protein [Allomuricauda ochracea]
MTLITVLAIVIGLIVIIFSITSIIESNHPNFKQREIERSPKDQIINQLKQTIKDVEEEYEQHRRRALEREQRIMREWRDLNDNNNNTA